MAQVFWGYLLMINLLTFVYRGVDKRKAVHNGKQEDREVKKYVSRVSEKQLLVLVILGGGVGGLLGMSLFRHKISKGTFLWKIFLILMIWVLIVLYFMGLISGKEI